MTVRVLIVMAWLAAAGGSAHAAVLKVGERAVELDTAVDAAGKPVRLAAYRGHWVVIAIGAAWCDPCKAELPVLDRFAGEFSAVFISLAIDNEISDGKAFHDRLKLKRLVRVYMPEERSAIAGRYGAAKMPSTFVIDPEGFVKVVHDGFDHRAVEASTKKLRAALASKLPVKPATPTPAPTPKPAPPKPAVTPTPTPTKVSAIPPLVWPAPQTRWWSDDWRALRL